MFEFTTQGTCSKKIFVELDGKRLNQLLLKAAVMVI